MQHINTEDIEPVELFNVCSDLVIGDGPMMSHVSVISKYKYWYRFGNFRQFSFHVVIRPVAKNKRQ